MFCFLFVCSVLLSPSPLCFISVSSLSLCLSVSLSASLFPRCLSRRLLRLCPFPCVPFRACLLRCFFASAAAARFLPRCALSYRIDGSGQRLQLRRLPLCVCVILSLSLSLSPLKPRRRLFSCPPSPLPLLATLFVCARALLRLASRVVGRSAVRSHRASVAENVVAAEDACPFKTNGQCDCFSLWRFPAFSRPLFLSASGMAPAHLPRRSLARSAGRLRPKGKASDGKESGKKSSAGKGHCVVWCGV